jgi:hypothetical protein
MVRSCVVGLIKMMGGKLDVEPNDDELEQRAFNFFSYMDKDGSNNITFEEFLQWARSDRDMNRCLSEDFTAVGIDSAAEDSASELSDLSVLSDVEETLMDDDALAAAHAALQSKGALRVSARGVVAAAGRPGSGGGDEEASAEASAAADAVARRARRLAESSRAQGGECGHALEELFAAAAGADGDQFMAVQPWLGAVKEPSAWHKPSKPPGPPDSSLDLEWVHGYRAHDCRNNVRYIVGRDPENDPGEVVYHAAALGIVYSPAEHSQRFYHGHTDDVISLAVHRTGLIVATGQIGATPAVHVWDAHTMQNLAVLAGLHKRGVSLLAFSNDGNLLATVGLDGDHCVAVYDWRTQALVASGKGSKEKCMALAWAPDDRTLLLTGDKHVSFLSITGKTFKCKRGVLGKLGKLQHFLSAGFLGADAVVGTTDGSLYRFSGTALSTVVRAHHTAVNAMYIHRGSVIITSSSGGTVKAWDHNLKPLLRGGGSGPEGGKALSEPGGGQAGSENGSLLEVQYTPAQSLGIDVRRYGPGRALCPWVCVG